MGIFCMVNYPNGKKKAYTSKPTSAGGRGMVLEKDINVTNMFYLSIDKGSFIRNQHRLRL